LLIGAFASWGLHLYFETKYNRCPNCEHVPMDGRGQVDFNPAVCPKCGARLRAYDSFL
jgi:transcription initiation factor IIE alpha subunit